MRRFKSINFYQIKPNLPKNKILWVLRAPPPDPQWSPAYGGELSDPRNSSSLIIDFWLCTGLFVGMEFPWESQGKCPMG